MLAPWPAKKAETLFLRAFKAVIGKAMEAA
jgi:hypothetical protein